MSKESKEQLILSQPAMRVLLRAVEDAYLARLDAHAKGGVWLRDEDEQHLKDLVNLLGGDDLALRQWKSQQPKKF